jgi:hypothetical protein
MGYGTGGMFREPGKAGYCIVAGDGGVFAKGSNVFYGSAAGVLSGTGRQGAPTPTGNGYLILSDNGTVYAYGDAVYRGNGGANARGIAFSPSGNGYWITHDDGSVWSFGDAVYAGNAP